MPNLLRKLVKPRRPPPQPALDLLASPAPSLPPERSNTDELTNLAQRVLGKLDYRDAEEIGTSKRLSQQVEDRLLRRQAATQVRQKTRSKRDKMKSVIAPASPPPVQQTLGGDDAQKVLAAVLGSIEVVEQLQVGGLKKALSDKLLDRCSDLLSAQRDELKDVLVYMERGRYPALRTLRQVYERVLSGLAGLEDLAPAAAAKELAALVQLLEEGMSSLVRLVGPDYLIDTFLIELVIHHAEILDSTLAAEIRSIFKKAVARPGDLNTFRRAAQGIVAYACAIPQEDLEDEMGREAYNNIGVLVNQLKMRVESEATAVATPPETPLSSDDEHEVLSGADLQARFGTGPIATTALPKAATIGTPDEPIPKDKGKSRASAPASPTPSSSSGSSLSSISLYDYRGQILTASALDLVMRQEALAIADSTGQYTGEVSWDDIRKAWIPHYVVKLKDHDLAPGEIPSTNPDDYEVKREDDFGNKIGWTETGEMYYEEEPTFELK